MGGFIVFILVALFVFFFVALIAGSIRGAKRLNQVGSIINDEAKRRKDQSKNTGGFDVLEKLAGLRDKGVITSEEFEAKKKEILGL